MKNLTTFSCFGLRLGVRNVTKIQTERQADGQTEQSPVITMHCNSIAQTNLQERTFSAYYIIRLPKLLFSMLINQMICQ